MRFGIILGILGAIFLHVLFLAFGGIFFMHGETKTPTREVELVSDAAPEKEEEKKEEVPEEKTEEIQEAVEDAPDAEEIVRSLEAMPASNDAPALAEASLAAIEQALSGGGGGGDAGFGGAMDFSSGGRIGGTGTGALGEEKLDDAFSMSEIDQRPRPVYQVAGNYPSQMRGKKVEGVVTVIFIVDETGRVKSPRIEKSSDPAFDKPALDAVKQWKFEPAVKGGQRVACRMRVPMRFQPR